MSVPDESLIGRPIPSHFHAGIVTASYFASLCGSLLTVEMLHRRATALRNLRSWLETLGCATAMGLVGIWCMHFIGNRAIILGDGSAPFQLVYNTGFTTLSVFLPIIGLTIAFSAAEVSSKSQCCHWVLLGCTGVFAGMSIVGMHYIGNLGVSNYDLHYQPRFLAASMIIAVGDCLAVLVLFYTLREKWINSWWKRMSCAAVLAGGVSAMHFTASSNCVYTLRVYSSPQEITSRNTQVEVAGVLCGTSAVIILGVLFFTRHRIHVLKSRSQKVMLGIANFDADGRILVTTEGILPAREITNKYYHDSFSDEFDTAHPVFLWIYRVTRNWSSVAEFIPKMRNHINAQRLSAGESEKRPGAAASTRYEPSTYHDYSVIFRERFCVAAAQLAASMHVPLDQMGVLYDKVVETGTLVDEGRSSKRHTLQSEDGLGDVEKAAGSVNAFGRGQVLFLTRLLSHDEADKLRNAGFRFASSHQVGRHIADTMQVPLAALDVHMLDIKRYADSLQSVEKPGTWLSYFAMVAKPNNKGFDVVVSKSNQDQLPDVQLMPGEPQAWQTEFLERMDGMKTRSCLAFVEDRRAQRTVRQQQFALMLQQSIYNLGKKVPCDLFQEARFYAKPVQAHYSQRYHNDGIASNLYAFCVIVDTHTPTGIPSDHITRIPLNFLTTKQRCFAGSPDHITLSRDIHREFSPLLARKVTLGSSTTSNSLSGQGVLFCLPTKRLQRKMSSRRGSTRRTSSTLCRQRHEPEDLSSLHDLISTRHLGSLERQHSQRTEDDITVAGGEREHENPLGGILVNSETVVKSDYGHDLKAYGKTCCCCSCAQQHGSGLGVGTEVVVGTAQQEMTFVDELVAVTKARFFAPKIG